MMEATEDETPGSMSEVTSAEVHHSVMPGNNGGGDPLEAAKDDEAFILILFIDHGVRFSAVRQSCSSFLLPISL